MSDIRISEELNRVIAVHFRSAGNFMVLGVLGIGMTAAVAAAQTHPQAGGEAHALVQGRVRDANGKPVANATVVLKSTSTTLTSASPSRVTHTDSEGVYRFASVRAGAYELRAESDRATVTIGPVNITEEEAQTMDLVLAAPAGKSAGQTPDFFDEPQFTVAGVTQATKSGGHGSDTVLRTSEALARSTLSLSTEKESVATPSMATSSAATSSAAETSLQGEVARDPDNLSANRQLGALLVNEGKVAEAVPFLQRASRLNPGDAELHRLLGDADEKLANPLDAVREYQRAAELDPTEPNLFDWGTELLTHRALEPATEVFAKGNRLYPKSVRTLVALGVVWYARGSSDQAAQYLVNASDLAPDNPTPYLFLGRMQTVETTPSKAAVETLARFAKLQPDNALANYYYAVALWKQSASAVDGTAVDSTNGGSAQVESLLLKAVNLDPKLGAADLQLGIIYSQRTDFLRAIAAYRKAIEVIPEGSEGVSPEFEETLGEAHYRLAQVYVRIGDKARAQEQLKLHHDITRTNKRDTERERRETLGFSISQQQQ